jgi:hypothetical protein
VLSNDEIRGARCLGVDNWLFLLRAVLQLDTKLELLSLPYPLVLSNDEMRGVLFLGVEHWLLLFRKQSKDSLIEFVELKELVGLYNEVLD